MILRIITLSFVLMTLSFKAKALTECPSGMVLLKLPSSPISDCVCPLGQGLSLNIAASAASASDVAPYKFGKCTDSYTTVTSKTPLRALTPILWLDATDIHYNGMWPNSSTLINRWVDKSGNRFDATQGIAANQPTFLYPTFTDRVTPYASFGGTQNMSFASASFSPVVSYSSGATIFLVLNNSTNTAGYPLYYGNTTDGNNTWYIKQNTSTSYSFSVVLGGTTYTATTAVTASSRILLTAQYNGTTRVSSIQNNASAAVTSGAAGIGFAARATSYHLLGSTYNGGILEVIVYNSTLSASQISAIKDYLNIKYVLY
jgi:hypothetical protein